MGGTILYQDLIIEKDEMPLLAKEINYGFLKLFHNCDPGGERFKITFFDNIEKKYFDDYLVIQQESFDAIEIVFTEIIVGFDIYSSVNPLKGYGMSVAFQKCISVIDDLNRGVITDNLRHYLNNMSVESFDKSIDRITWHSSDGNVHRDDEKYWTIIFEYSDKIINFYNAFFNYVFEVIKCSADSIDDMFLINIDGY